MASVAEGDTRIVKEETEQKTSDFYRTDPNLPERFKRPSLLQGYSRSAHVHPLYRTTNQTYGNAAPTVHHMPTHFAALSSRFSTEQLQRGMFVSSSLNTSLDKSHVHLAKPRPMVHAHLPEPMTTKKE